MLDQITKYLYTTTACDMYKYNDPGVIKKLQYSTYMPKRKPNTISTFKVSGTKPSNLHVKVNKPLSQHALQLFFSSSDTHSE